MATYNQSGQESPNNSVVKTSCDVCKQRTQQKVVPSFTKCRECKLCFCEECDFTHSKIPACTTHSLMRMLGGVPYEGTSVDDDSLCTDGASEDESAEGAEAFGLNCPQFKLKFQFTTDAGESDEVPPLIRDVVLLDSDIILATDWGNCSIKAFDKEGKFLGDHFFPKSGQDAGRIHGLTQKDPNTVYATLPSYKKIATISVKHTTVGKVAFSRILQATKRRYFGIAHLAGTKQLVVGTTDSVDILSYNCRHLQSLPQRGFANPYNMGIETRDSVLVADTKTNCLFRISSQQEVTKIEFGDHGDYKQLRGVTADSNGNIFFGALKSEGIGWINSDGELIGSIVAEDVNKVVGIHCKKTESGQWVVVSQDDGVIKVFAVQ